MPIPRLAPITSTNSTNGKPNSPVFVVEINPDTGISTFRHLGSYPVGSPIDTVLKRVFKEGLIGAGIFFAGEISQAPILHPVGQVFTVKDDGSITQGVQQQGLLTSWPPKKR